MQKDEPNATRGQLVECFGRIAHNGRSQAVRIAEQFKTGRRYITVHIAVLSPFADAFSCAIIRGARLTSLN